MTTTFTVEFLPGIWISNNKILSEKFLKQKKIKEILDCNKELTFFDGIENYIIAIKNQIKKDKHIQLQKYLNKISDIINQTILDGDALIIYDPLITSKGPVLIIAYLLKYGMLRPEQTIHSFISKCKIPIKIDENYQLGLKIFYKNLEAQSQ
jgi:hypothetical protein